MRWLEVKDGLRDSTGNCMAAKKMNAESSTRLRELR
jgi:hypothetical protein